MYKLKIVLLLIIIIATLGSCNARQDKNNTTTTENAGSIYKKNISQYVNITLFDDYARKNGHCIGALIEGNTVAASMSDFKEAGNCKFSFPGVKSEPVTRGYTYSNPFLNLVFLKVSGPSHPCTPIESEINKGDSVYFIEIQNGYIQRFNIFVNDSVTIENYKAFKTNTTIKNGMLLYSKNHKIAGVTTNIPNFKGSTIIIPAQTLAELLSKKDEKALLLPGLRLQKAKKYPNPQDIDLFIVETNMGNFSIKLWDINSIYSKNFIKLVSDGYYDSLLFHRVIPGFLIQTGAADTKYAHSGDLVGYQGPGYTQETIIDHRFYHKRGAVAMSKPPEFNNTHNRTDGAQFYIIIGRKHSEAELDELEQRKGYKYTPEQRSMYLNIGGAAYLDNDFPVFAEIFNGMEVLSKIANSDINSNERPAKDVRVKRITIKLR